MTTTTNTRTAAATTGTGDPGTTTIEDSVVAEVAGRAAAEVQGVHALGGGAARVIGAVRTAMNNPDPRQGTQVTITDKKVEVDVTFSAEYPVDLQKVATDVRSAVILAVETIVGFEVTAVNITINDLYTPDPEGTAPEEQK